ncbi:hypothetical protein ACFY78_10210 [Streptomyces olindensis]|uniref:hypothetical protein n=1 Tax=Streptomyces olindensis TaxID=358823 RepID=UPI00367421FA
MFGAADSGVPNRTHPDGRTFLDILWRQARFATSAHFVRAVRPLAGRRLAENLLTRTEHDRVLSAANEADLRR